MMRDDRAGDAAAEPLSRLLARSEAASREVEHVLARIDELVARLEQDGSGPGVNREVHEVPRVAEVPRVGEVAEGQVAVEASSGRTVTAAGAGAASPTPRSDPWRYLTERLLLAHDAANGHANGDASVDHDIVILQEAARRRLSDER